MHMCEIRLTPQAHKLSISHMREQTTRPTNVHFQISFHNQKQSGQSFLTEMSFYNLYKNTKWRGYIVDETTLTDQTRSYHMCETTPARVYCTPQAYRCSTHRNGDTPGLRPPTPECSYQRNGDTPDLRPHRMIM